MQDYAGIIIRLSFIYLFALLMARLSGKRSIGDLSAMDFIVVLILGDQFDNVFWGDNPVAYGVVAIAVIFFWHVLMAFLSSRFKGVAKLLGSSPTQIVRSGKFVRAGMLKERSNQDHIETGLRLLGEDNIKEIREANWEPSGQISALKKEAAKTVQKQDLPRLKELFK